MTWDFILRLFVAGALGTVIGLGGALVEQLAKDDTNKNAQQKPEGQTIE